METPKYKQIYDALLARLEEGFWTPKSKIYSERQLAKVYNVSRLTVKRALTQLISDGYLEYHEGRQGTFVSDLTQKTTLPEPIQKTRTIGVAVDNHTPAFASYLLQGIHDALWSKGYHTIYCNTYHEEQQIHKQIDSLVASGVSGIIYSPVIGPDSQVTNKHILDRFEQNDIPTVLVDRFIEDRCLSHVVINNREAMRALTSKLFEMGHTRILVVAGYETTSTKDRQCGIQDAYLAAGINPAQMLLVHIDENDFFKHGSLSDNLYTEVTDFGNITAVIGLNQLLLRAGMKLTKEMQSPITTASIAASSMEMLGDISIIQPIYQMGFEAGNLMVREIDNPQTPVTQLILKAQIHPEEL